jgi:hypothetical protein
MRANQINLLGTVLVLAILFLSQTVSAGRQYNPTLMRFMQPDPRIANPYNPQDLNRYSYVRNNPLKYTDPTGELPNLAQAVDSANIVSYLRSVESKCQGCSVEQIIGEAARRFQRKEMPGGETVWGKGEKRGNMYFHTTSSGWVDSMHFFSCAELDLWTNDLTTKIAGYAVEGVQIVLPGGQSSAFSVEDLPSDWVGVKFGEYLKANKDSGLSPSELLEKYFKEIGATKMDDSGTGYSNLPVTDDRIWDQPYRSLDPNKKAYPEESSSSSRRPWYLGGTRDKTAK